MTSQLLPERSAFLRPVVIDRLYPDARETLLDRLASAGVEAVVVKLSSIDAGLREACLRHGLDLVASFPWYLRGEGERDPAPVDSDGGSVAQVEWYNGLVPGEPQRDADRLEQLAAELERALPTAVVLDFLRWPGHWELELRTTHAAASVSFDPHTLARFERFLAERHPAAAPLPTTPHAAARRIAEEHAEHWDDFRAETITRVADAAAGIVHAAGLPCGAFLVPLEPAALRRRYGQDVAALARSLDGFVVMSYDAIVQEAPAWVLEVHGAISAAAAGRPVWPMVQLGDDSAPAGPWDWGVVDPPSRAALLDDVERARADGRIPGYCTFPGELTSPSSRDTRVQADATKGDRT